jgi:hypothetical protein
VIAVLFPLNASGVINSQVVENYSLVAIVKSNGLLLASFN